MARIKPQKTKTYSRDLKFLLLRIPVLLVILIFFGVTIYPFVSDTLNTQFGQRTLSSYMEKARKLTESEQKKRDAERAVAAKNLAYKMKDPFSEESIENARDSFRAPEPLEFYEKHMLGILYLPKIHQTLAIFDSIADSFLAHGAGWIPKTSDPFGGTDKHSLLSSHRGLREARLFTDLPKYEKGDVFILLVNNEYHAYKVIEKNVVKPEEMDKTKVVPGKDLMTLVTCTPYSINTHRLLVTGERVPFTPTMLADIASIGKYQNAKEKFVLSLPVIVVTLAVLYMWHCIRAFKRKHYLYEISFRLLDHATDSPVENITYQLWNKNGKRPVKRNGENILLNMDKATEIFQSKDLPGRNYILKPVVGNFPEFHVRVKKLRQIHFDLKPKKNRQRVKRRVLVNDVCHFWMATS
jgi:sortase A